jgi:DNA-directed RNA polymerase specialized sigma24 family protein
VDGDGRVGDPFRAFVVARRPELLQTALLLTGDRSSAEALVQRTLTRCRRRWPRLTASGDPLAAVRAALVVATVRRRPQLLRTEQVLESARSAEHTAPARALRELPPLSRAVVVLRWHADLPVAEVAAALDRPVAAVAAAAADGLARLTDVLPPAGYERDPAAVDDEARLGALLARLSATAEPWQLDTDAAVADVRQRRRTVRRSWAGGLVAAACVVAVAVPLWRSAPPPPPATPATTPSAGPSAQPPPIAPRSGPVLVGPTRGSLAGDPAFLVAVRQAGWGAQVPPPVEDRQVVFAADTPDGRVALVTGTVHEDFRGVWLTGPVGAPADQLTVHVPARLGPDRPVTLVLGGPGPATLVVVAGPADRVELSDRLQVGPRGTVARSYAAVEAADGTAVVPVRTTAAGTAVSVRVTREGRVVHRSGADGVRSPPAPAAAPPVPDRLRPVPAFPDAGLLTTALTDLAAPLAVEPAALEAELLWSDVLPGARPGSVAVVLAHSPGGALLVGTWARVGSVTVLCGVQTPPGTADVARLTVARVCDTTSPTSAPGDGGRWLVVSAPVSGGTAELLDARDRPVATVPLSGGGAVTALPPDAAEVLVRDAAGATVTRAPVAPMATEVFGDFGVGPPADGPGR